MPTLYGISASPFVRKVRVVLAEKGIQYQLDPVMPMNVSPEFKKMSPLGKVPAYKDGARVLADSSVICAYLERIQSEPSLYPADPYDYGRVLWFEEYSDTALAGVLTAKLFFKKCVGPKFRNEPFDEAELKTIYEEEAAPLFKYLEGEVWGRGSIVGNKFSIADISIATQFVNLWHAGMNADPKRWPKLSAYVNGIHARPSFRTLMEEEAPIFGTPLPQSGPGGIAAARARLGIK